MGYETTLIIADIIVDKYASPIAIIELCKTGQGPFDDLRVKSATENIIPGVSLSQIFDIEYAKKFYGRELDIIQEAAPTSVTRDYYDEPLVVMRPEEVLDTLKEEIQIALKAGQEPYWRFVVAMHTLQAVMALGNTNNLYVLTYGH